MLQYGTREKQWRENIATGVIASKACLDKGDEEFIAQQGWWFVRAWVTPYCDFHSGWASLWPSERSTYVLKPEITRGQIISNCLWCLLLCSFLLVLIFVCAKAHTDFKKHIQNQPTFWTEENLRERPLNSKSDLILAATPSREIDCQQKLWKSNLVSFTSR